VETTEHRYLSDFARRYFGEGEAKGRAEGEAKGRIEGKAEGIREALLTLSTSRSIVLSEEDRAAIASTSDLATLETSLRRVARAVTTREIVNVFRATPGFALDLLRAMGITGEAVLSGAPRLLESSSRMPLPEGDADLAIAFDIERGVPGLVVLVEVQLAIDAEKRRSWPLHEAIARLRFACDACIVVVTLDEEVEAWAATPIVQGPGNSVFHALVVGPSALRLFRDKIRQSPELALLSALCQGAYEPERIRAALLAIDKLEFTQSKAYFDLLKYHRGEALDRMLREAIAPPRAQSVTEFVNKHLREGEAKGIAEGKAKGFRRALLTVSAARGIALSSEDRAKIAACSNLALLEAWVTRASQAVTPEEIF
jgi:flagellar biosynthesis/type III secretory pathway protein FliH